MRPSYVYDIETEDWTTFVVGALYDGKRIEIYDWRREREFVSRLLSLTGEVYAHNGGRFDHLWLLDASYRFGLARRADVIANSSGIICIDFKSVRFLDSYRLFPMSLRRLTNGKKQSLSKLCKCGNDCGGYCAIHRKMPTTTSRIVIDYLQGDVRELWNALDYFGRVAQECQIELGLTIGSTAWKSAERELSLPPEPYGEDVSTWAFVREAYFGGRCELFRKSSREGYQYDVNSMYPSKIASVPLPLGYRGAKYGTDASKAYGTGKPGVYHACVRIPESFIPPLPFRTTQGHRIFFPTGEIIGTWTALELQYAESQGVKIQAITKSVVFDREEVLFKSWVERIFKVRMKYGKESREGYWLKTILNSITGKFGAKIHRSNIVVDPESSNPEFDCEGWYVIGDPKTSRVYGYDYEKIARCGHVEWSAYLTSAARVTLHKGLTEHDNGNDAVYCDTDSIFSESERKVGVGSDLGQWGEQGAYERFSAIAPKVYCYHQRDTGIPVVRAKGIPNPNVGRKATTDFWKGLTEGKPTTYWSIAGIRNPQLGRFFARRYLSRKVKPNCGGRIGDGVILTRPPRADEIPRLEKKVH